MARTDGFYHLSADRLISIGDPDYEYKLLRLGHIGTDSPLEVARILLDRAQRLTQLGAIGPAGLFPYEKEIRLLREEAKGHYFQALRHKESLEVHQYLAPLLSAAEAKDMLTRYRRYPKIRDVYRDRLEQLGQHVPNVSPGWAHTAGLVVGGVVVAGAIGALSWVLLQNGSSLLPSGRTAADTNAANSATASSTATNATASTSLTDTRTTDTRVTRNYTNIVTFIEAIPQMTFDGVVQVDGTDPSHVAQLVDEKNIPTGESYVIQQGSNPIGYVTSKGEEHYDIRLVNVLSPASVSPVSTHGTVNVTPFELNATRTAYAYYLSTHDNVPPASIAALKAMVPSQVPLQGIVYTPSTNPELALTAPGQSVPFETPKVTIDISHKTLAVTYQGQTLLTSPIGVGSKSQPTPTGTFTITDRMPNNLSPLYGDYILPLNNSSFAIHGTNQPDKIGQNMSLGCIETPNKINDQLYQTLPVGTPVLIRSDTHSGTSSPNVYRR